MSRSGDCMSAKNHLVWMDVTRPNSDQASGQPGPQFRADARGCSDSHFGLAFLSFCGAQSPEGRPKTIRSHEKVSFFSSCVEVGSK
jgi:hypothetical protein